MPISRRQFVSTAAGAGIASVVAPRLTLAQAGGPIRIGLLAAKTGPLASGGIDMELALTMFLKDRENTLAGRKVELIVADTAGVPATARIDVRKFREQELAAFHAHKSQQALERRFEETAASDEELFALAAGEAQPKEMIKDLFDGL